MLMQKSFVKACLIGTALSGGLISGAALAETATPAKGAFAQAEPVPFWWFHGTVEAGGRFFLNNPNRNGSAYLNQGSLAKYYEYSSVKPGPFSNIWLSTGSNDGLFRIDASGKNIGYSDQSYYLDMSKAGEQYFNFSWDQSPHIYSTSAQTPYQGVGTNALTLPSGLVGPGVMTAARLNPYLQQTDVGIKRDTAAVEYRWTPTDAWDIQADYSHLRRTGTQVDGVVGFDSSTSAENPTQVPKPVQDTTQNFGLNGEYAGTSPWGKFTFKAGYQGSQYTDDSLSYTAQNPFCTTGGVCPGAQAQFARMSMWPSNQANGFNGTLAAELPMKSRYVGTVSYTMMRQNSAFQPMTNNPVIGTPSAAILPASSLNGAINTTLINNVITTQINPELKSKISYRYYDYQNNTPELLFANWISSDQTGATSGTGLEASIRSLSMSYTKQTTASQLNWRPTREWNFTAEYGFEHNSYDRMDAAATNENSGKLSADWKPASWATLRTSGYIADRRYSNYDHMTLASYQFPTTTFPSSWTYLSNQRQMMLDNRRRTKANVGLDIVVMKGVTITPNYKYQDDNYNLNPNAELGLATSRVQGGGIDIGYVPTTDLSFVFGYLREYYDQQVYGYSSSSSLYGSATRYPINITAKDTIDTFTAAANYAAIPNQLDLNLRYTAARAVDSTRLNIAPTTNAGVPNNTTPGGGQWTDVKTWFQRFDATATYKVDPTVVTQMGVKGDVKVKLRYTWERNSVANWQNDPIAPISPGITGTPSAIWLASDNPNYNVHMLAASLVVAW